MLYKIVNSINMIIEKWLRVYRRISFEAYTGKKTDKLHIVGKIYIRNPNVHLGSHVTLYPGVMLQGEGDIFIGNNTFLGNNCVVYSEKGHSVHIGSDCMIAAMCHIIDTDHNTILSEQHMINQGTVSDNIVIEDDVWLASAVTVAKGSYIEQGAVIGAKAFVKGKVEKNTIYAGIPARPIKKRRSI